MNWGRGLFRLWAIFAILWVAILFAIFVKEGHILEANKTYEVEGRFKEKYEIVAPPTATADALYEEMEPFAETIRDANVTSVAGLRAKTLVAIWDYQPLSSRHEGNFELDHEDSHWSLFSGAVAVTGLSHMVSDLQTRLQIDASIP